MFKNHIYQRRRELGFTQDCVAQVLGVTRGTIAAHERGKRAIPKKYAQGYCEVLRITGEDLFS